MAAAERGGGVLLTQIKNLFILTFTSVHTLETRCPIRPMQSNASFKVKEHELYTTAAAPMGAEAMDKKNGYGCGNWRRLGRSKGRQAGSPRLLRAALGAKPPRLNTDIVRSFTGGIPFNMREIHRYYNNPTGGM